MSEPRRGAAGAELGAPGAGLRRPAGWGRAPGAPGRTRRGRPELSPGPRSGTPRTELPPCGGAGQGQVGPRARAMAGSGPAIGWVGPGGGRAGGSVPGARVQGEEPGKPGLPPGGGGELARACQRRCALVRVGALGPAPPPYFEPLFCVWTRG